MASTVFVFFVALFLLQIGSGKDIFWAKNSNWNNQDNWSLGRLPCKGDIADFSKVIAVDGRVPLIYFNTNSTVRKLVLPRNGKIVLKPSITIRLAVNESCEVAANAVPIVAGQTNDFIGVRENRWECPGNWVDKDGSSVPSAPCGGDSAVFTDSGFSFVTSEVQQIQVDGVQLRGTKLVSLDGYDEFIVNVSATTNRQCRANPSLCPCIAVDSDCYIVSSISSSVVSTSVSMPQPTRILPPSDILPSYASATKTIATSVSMSSVRIPNVGISSTVSVPPPVVSGPIGPINTVGASHGNGGAGSGAVIGVVVGVLVIIVIVAVVIVAVVLLMRKRKSYNVKHQHLDEDPVIASKDSGTAAYDNPIYDLHSGDPMDQLVPMESYDNPIY